MLRKKYKLDAHIKHIYKIPLFFSVIVCTYERESTVRNVVMWLPYFFSFVLYLTCYLLWSYLWLACAGGKLGTH